MSYYRPDPYAYPTHYHCHDYYAPAYVHPLRAYQEPQRHDYVSYSSRSGLGGMGNPFREFFLPSCLPSSSPFTFHHHHLPFTTIYPPFPSPNVKTN